jgi:hypothetical protein
VTASITKTDEVNGAIEINISCDYTTLNPGRYASLAGERRQ